MKALVLNRVALVLSFAGILISGVLSIGVKYDAAVPCGMSGGCSVVAADPSSHALGIPNAYLGFGAYVVLAFLAFWRLINPAQARPALIAGYVLTALGTLGSLILTYVSLAVINATCIWCLSSTATMILLLIVHAGLMQAPAEEEPASGNTLLLVGTSLATTIALALVGAGMVTGRKPPIDSRILVGQPITTILPADAHVFGDKDSPVTVVEFGDLVCPTCSFEYPKIKQYVAQHPGQVKLAYRHFPLMDLPKHELATPAAIVSEIAAEKGRFWDFVQGMYNIPHEDLKSIDQVLDLAQSLGIDRDEAKKRMEDANDKAFKRMYFDLADGSKLGINGTPTYIIVAPGVTPRSAFGATLYDDLARPEYKKFIKGG